MSAAVEIEVKFRVADAAGLRKQLLELGFDELTPETYERNTLWDTPEHSLRAERAILRVRRYGERWVLTHKCLPKDYKADERHKHRLETETMLEDGAAMETILGQLGYMPAFVYEKWRSEFGDGRGHCVIDRTPIGVFAELEGAEEWIDEIAGKLGLGAGELLTLSYGRLFDRWRQETGSAAEHLTFVDCGGSGS